MFAESLKVMLKTRRLYRYISTPASGIEDMNIADAINKLQNWGYKGEIIAEFVSAMRIFSR